MQLLGGARRIVAGVALAWAVWPAAGGQTAFGEPPPGDGRALLAKLDAPLLFVKRHNYQGIHIYDTYYKWRPGGGIYVIENPSAPRARRRIRTIIDADTPNSLGAGIYSEPELSWDARRLLFCYKPAAKGSTSIYEIGVDGSGLRRLTDPGRCDATAGRFASHHDVGPAYLGDGRIVFTSTRLRGLVPCNNTGVDILHVMNADGSGIRPISVNNVNEFDPCVLPDGRILHGRWEYIDKTALTQQSVWTIFPDGTNETALFANNMVHPEAVLDARPVPGSEYLVVGTFTPHNSPPRGTIGLIDPYAGKNAPGAIFNFEHPEHPTRDRGESCEPWPLSQDVVLYSGRPRGGKRNAVMLIDRRGRRVVVHAEAGIDCHSPMLVKPRARPPAIPTAAKPAQPMGRFFVKDVYQGLDGVPRGDVTHLRVIEETSRTCASHGAAYNQTFLMSGVLAWSAKNYLGIVPVEADGSAYFEVPAGRAIYLQALDADGRLVQSMRTFVQAAPGVTRSCVGCHEYKYGAPPKGVALAMKRPPRRLRDESWGSGFIDYPSMVQPVLDRHCVRCHGGEEGFAAGLDLSGGWTEHFNISYENLISRRHSQLTAYLIAGIDCMNGTSTWSALIFAPRRHGSGAAPLAEVLVSARHPTAADRRGQTDHAGRIAELSRRERDLIFAWIDTNGLYHGTWNRSEHGCVVRSWRGVKQALLAEMQSAGCMRCHRGAKGAVRFESDWFNLRRPEYSRILRAPLAQGGEGLGAALCRNRKVDPRRRRVRILMRNYVHAALPLEAWKPPAVPPPPKDDGEPAITLASADDPHYRAMLAAIRRGREQALARPRVDMPGAQPIPGTWRQIVPTPLPDRLPGLAARADADGVVHLSWPRSARTLGLSAELHRLDAADAAPTKETLIAETRLFHYADADASPGEQHYALVLVSQEQRSAPIRAAVTVPPPAPPPVPTALKAAPAPGRVELTWRSEADKPLRYHVYRAEADGERFDRLTAEPIAQTHYSDAAANEGVRYAYTVRAVTRRGTQSQASSIVRAASLPEVKEPVFVARFAENASAAIYGGGTVRGRARGKAAVRAGALDLRGGGYVTFAHRGEFDLTRCLSVECRLRITAKSAMPVIVSCGHWRQAGWFLQRFGGGWRWHVGGIDCDGGKPAGDRWTHLVGTFDGQTARLYQDGRLVAERAGQAIRTPWRGALHVGQYSGGPGPQYQVLGWLADLRIYGRALPAKDVAAAFRATAKARQP